MEGTEFRLFYLKGRGPAELVRFLLAHSGRAFQDCRLTLAQWREIRGSDKRIVLPLLEVEGKEVLSGCVPIALFLAAKLGLSGAGKEEEALVSQVVEAVGALQAPLGHVVRAALARQEDKRKLEWELYLHRHLRPFMNDVEGLLRASKSPCLVGGSLSAADVALGEFLGRMEECYDSNVLREHPRLKRLVQRIEDLPRISDWIASRPHSLF